MSYERIIEGASVEQRKLIAELQEQLERTERVAATLHESAVSLGDENDSLKEQLEAARAEIEWLKTTYGEGFQAAREMSELREQLQAVRGHHEKAVVKIHLVTGRADLAEARAAKLQEQLEAAQGIVDAARALPEFFEAGDRTHSFVPLLDVLDSNPASDSVEQHPAMDHRDVSGRLLYPAKERP